MTTLIELKKPRGKNDREYDRKWTTKLHNRGDYEETTGSEKLMCYSEG
jgi:hypothetical protein